MQPPRSTAELGWLRPWESMPAAQQPEWRDHASFEDVCRRLALTPPLAKAAEIQHLRRSLIKMMKTGAFLLQSGDCAESFYECTDLHITEKIRVIERLGDHLSDLTGQNVIRVGRMGGQFAKPRSQATEDLGGLSIPSFRGHMINSEIASLPARTADPQRMLRAYEASDKVQRAMRVHRQRQGLPAMEGPWSSHEALVIDYESRMLRPDPDSNRLYLTSAHLPWVGERTRHSAGAHIALLSSVANPVGCKLGPASTPGEVLNVCEALNPRREPGRLVLIPRMGRDLIQEVLPPIVRAVANGGYPVIWLSDPMHGNTVRSRRVGLKTRYLDDVVTEALRFRDILEASRQHPAGLHIEVATGDVTECIGGSVEGEDDLLRNYSSLCDPRLNADQAMELIEAWARGAVACRTLARRSQGDAVGQRMAHGRRSGGPKLVLADQLTENREPSEDPSGDPAVHQLDGSPGDKSSNEGVFEGSMTMGAMCAVNPDPDDCRADLGEVVASAGDQPGSGGHHEKGGSHAGCGM
ncbi:3-deoxy-7-phosphoheptulonate synthase [Nonomuraea sp. NPDC059023]|uniref:3-deoxy-7-phosphoheptulonate synthase n=1 Tax=Nonomuraea sp. NPDC059023 TaxID=3346706 RepID=UPI00367E6ABD